MASIKFTVLLGLAFLALALAVPADRVKKDVVLGTYPYAYSYPYAGYAAAPLAYSPAYYHPAAAYSALPLASYRTVYY